MSSGIQKIFAEIPATYERINHILTFGFDILWRRKIAKMVSHQKGTRRLDVCTGTGETANYLRRYAGRKVQVYAADFSLPMLKEAQKKPSGKSIRFVLGDVKCLPFPDNSFDLITLSFATRNINTSRAALIQSFREFHRILKPGGWFVNLETSQPQSRFIRRLYHLYVKIFIKPIGSRISGSKSGYAYLSATIPRFYTAEELVSVLKNSGFTSVRFQRLLFGIAAIHRADR